MFWTSGRFDNKFEDGKFRWTSTNRLLDTHFSGQAPPFPFSWWDDQPIILKFLNKISPNAHRRNTMNQPCVALALNPQDTADRPKLNFKEWYCNFPMVIKSLSLIYFIVTYAYQLKFTNANGLVFPLLQRTQCDRFTRRRR